MASSEEIEAALDAGRAAAADPATFRDRVDAAITAALAAAEKVREGNDIAATVALLMAEARAAGFIAGRDAAEFAVVTKYRAGITKAEIVGLIRALEPPK